jgi:hypothetical protein
MVMPPRWGFDCSDFESANLDGKIGAFILWSCRPAGALIILILKL